MSYLSIVAWAAMVATVTGLILLLIAGLARHHGSFQTERVAVSCISMVLATLIVGTILLLLVASWSYVARLV